MKDKTNYFYTGQHTVRFIHITMCFYNRKYKELKNYISSEKEGSAERKKEMTHAFAPLELYW